MPRNLVELSCSACGSNRLRFPATDAEAVTCEDCGAPGPSLREVKATIAAGVPKKGKKAGAELRSERRERHSSEVEASQAGLRKSVAETDRLVVASDKMLRRHRKECDEDDGA